MTKNLLRLISLWGGLSKEIREAIEYSVREKKTTCELWIGGDSSKKILTELGFELEVITKEGLTREYITISWSKMKE